MTNNTKSHFKAAIENRLQELIKDAGLLGFVITIDTQSKTPLAMGNVEMIPSVRDARHPTYLNDDLLKAIVKTHKDPSNLCVYRHGEDYLLTNVLNGRGIFLGVIREDQYIRFVKDHIHVSEHNS